MLIFFFLTHILTIFSIKNIITINQQLFMLLETAATSCLFSKKCACVVGLCTQEEEGCTQNSNSG